MSGAAAAAAVVRLLVGVLVTALVFAGLLFASEVALQVSGRGLHSFTSQLNFSALYGIGGARKDCVARV